MGSKVLWSLGRGKKNFRAKEPAGGGWRKVWRAEVNLIVGTEGM